MSIDDKRLSKRREGGFTLFEVALAATLMSAASILAMTHKLSESELEQAKNVGVILQQYNAGVQRWAQDNPGAENDVHSGSLWLKPTSCGGLSSEAYLPCNFPDLTSTSPTRFGEVSVTSEISTTGVIPYHETRVTTKTTPFISGRTDTRRPDLAGVAALTASAASTTGSIKSSVEDAQLTMIAGNVASTDPWLRTDGFNKMSASIGFDESLDPSLRQVTGLSRISGIAGQVLSIGRAGGASLGHEVVIDADQDLYGKLSVGNIRNSGTAIEVTKGGIDVKSGGITSSGNITSESELKGRKIVATTDISAPKIVANTDISAPIFYDRNNSSFYLRPSGSSRLGTLTVTNNATIQNATLRGNSSIQNATLSGNSSADGSFTPPLVSNMSASCIRGRLARNSDGEMLSCVSGKWKKAGGVNTITDFKPCKTFKYANRTYSINFKSGDRGKVTTNTQTIDLLCLDAKVYTLGIKSDNDG